MEILYKSKYQKISFDQETSIMHNVWLPESFTMREDDYKTELMKLVQLIDRYSATKQLIDTLNFQFTIDVNLQEWTDEEINKKNREAGIEKVAFIIADEIFSQMSIEQTMDGDAGQNMSVQYFVKEEEARKWLIA